MLGRRGSAAPRFVTRRTVYCPTTPRAGETSQRAAAASAAGVPPGRACHGPPRAGESHGAAGDSSAGMSSRAGLRQPGSARRRSRTRLRQPLRVCLRPRARSPRCARLPPAPRSATPAPSPRPVAAPTHGALRPASLPPDGSTPSAPASAAQAFPSSYGAWGGGAGRPGSRQTAASGPRANLRVSAAPRVYPNLRPVPGAGRPHVGEGPRPRRRTRYGLVSSSRRASIILRPR